MTKSKYEIYCKSCGCLMKKRRGKFGDFYGCTGYPICKATMSLRDAALEDDPPDIDLERWDR